MLFTLSGILFSLSTLGALILHGVLKIYDAKGDLAEKNEKNIYEPFFLAISQFFQELFR